VIDAIKYPHLARMQEVQETSQAIGEFLDWLSEQRIDLCSIIPGTGHDRWAPITDGAEKLLARYFDIDLNAVERERRAVLAGVPAPAEWCDREGGCFCKFRNVACSNFVASGVDTSRADQPKGGA
jgi:hypothetical protein